MIAFLQCVLMTIFLPFARAFFLRSLEDALLSAVSPLSRDRLCLAGSNLMNSSIGIFISWLFV